MFSQPPFTGGSGGPGMAWQAICGKASSPLCELGWKSLGVLELTVLPNIEEDAWVPTVRDADALLVWGGTNSRPDLRDRR